jgi:COMPASS component SWD3
VVLWDVSSKEVLQTLHGHDGVVLGVDVGLKDQTIATCGLDGTVKIWKRYPLSDTLTNGHADSTSVTDGDHPPDADAKMKDADT